MQLTGAVLSPLDRAILGRQLHAGAWKSGDGRRLPATYHRIDTAPPAAMLAPMPKCVRCRAWEPGTVGVFSLRCTDAAIGN